MEKASWPWRDTWDGWTVDRSTGRLLEHTRAIEFQPSRAARCQRIGSVARRPPFTRESAMRLSIALALCVSTAALAQNNRAARFMDNCNNGSFGDNERFCETRDFTMAATRALTVDGRDNGGITVHGWDRNQVQVVAMVQANAESVS